MQVLEDLMPARVHVLPLREIIPDTINFEAQ